EVEFLRLPSRLAGEGVVLRDAAIVVEPDDRAGVVVRSLRALHLPTLAERKIQIAVPVEDDAAAEVDAARAFRALPEQHLHFLQLPAIQLCARELGSDAALSAGRSEEHTSELQSRVDLVCRLLLEKKKKATSTCLPRASSI